MPSVIHKTIPVQVWADVDEPIAEWVRRLNSIPGVRTHSSCQGTIGEDGPAPFRAYVYVSWPDEATKELLASEFVLIVKGANHGIVERRP